ncbi:LOW QUALITY PROTEIN: adenomatous polyposis coli protein 2 [Rhinatrema bivittatum]|uniref:LOW QUALITY PROTEIN: adenomatous polyposis coli protein 2 n=1 Tax=Rhinatrema bivittatum TaxID=194408 RepID=UPI001127BAF1|nr:LOW QUALITY PROTEIN: adenomatous polyposis coli protein 2 [Rhinatrema bivittatum]
MSGSVASYEQLVRQVEALKKENSHLRRELEGNSNHLSKLENETSDMKEVLKHLQGKLEQETGGDAEVMASSGQTEFLEQLKALQMDITSLYDLKFPTPALDQTSEVPARPGWPAEGSPEHSATLQRKGSLRDLSRSTLKHLDELDKERCFLLSEIDKEEKAKLWYYTQLQILSKRREALPHVETFSLQMDLIQQQLEFEAQHIRSLLEERFGTTDEMVQRAQIRASRLEQIESELVDVQKVQHGQAQESPESDGGPASSTHDEEEAGAAESKVEVVFWLLSMLATRDKEDMSRTLLAMSSSQDSCIAMRKSGCLPFLIQILHDTDRDATAPAGSSSKDSRMRANAALHNIVFSQPDEGQAKKEMRVLHVLEQVRSYSETCWDWLEMQNKDSGGGRELDGNSGPGSIEPQICQATCAVMKLSFDEAYRQAMNELGGLQAVAELLEVDYEMHKMTNDPLNLALRRYAGMALTNLTFGDVVNKATLSSRRGCMQAIVAHLASESEELHQVVSSILRNLSWRADINSKKMLREVGSVSGLVQCALRATKESTLKSILSALWNLSAHSTENKAAVCAVEGVLGFLVSTLTYKCQSNSLAIIESGGGILRNVSSLVATRDDYRQILRDHNCLQTLLQHLRSHSLTIVSNACGTLWNLSARNCKDQELLWDLGGVSMLRNLIHSKHKMIAMGSAAALRNLLANRPLKYKDAAVISPGSCMPSLYMRKQKALEAELDAKHLAEAFDTMEKQGLKNQNMKKPLRHIESLVKDYASDSGCFDDDEAPNVSSSVEMGNNSVLSMFLNSSFLQGQSVPRSITQSRCTEPEKESISSQLEVKKSQNPEDEASNSAEKLANKMSTTVAKIDKLVEDISTMHTSSDDSFSLSSEDHGMDWHCCSDELHETRAQSCSPCRFSDSSSFVKHEFPSRALTLLRLKTACTSLSTDSLNSGSTSDGYCTQEHMKPCSRASFIDYKQEFQRNQRRPSRLDLKSVLMNKAEKNNLPQNQMKESVEQEKVDLKAFHEKMKKTVTFPNPSNIKDPGGKDLQPKKDTASNLSADTLVHTIKLSPSYQHVPVLEVLVKSGLTPGVRFPSSSNSSTWFPSGSPQIGEDLSTTSEKLSAQTPTPQGPESSQKYSVEDTPVCFSRCSSLSSLSSADNILDEQNHSENEIDSDSSLEILAVEASSIQSKKSKRKGRERLIPEGSTMTAVGPGISQPIAIPFPKREKLFLRETSPSRNEDMTPSSSSENYIQETPLMMSRCSSVSSLGSFESPSIASSIQSDPCSEMISGTISPSELPDSPGQTMPPSRSKTPSFDLSSHPEKETSQFNIQWENNVKKFMEITDFKERFQFHPDIDSMIYFTVEKPNENFSCASSLSALPLHEHYVQKEVELKLIPPFSEKNSLKFVAHEKREEGRDERLLGRMNAAEPHELNSDDDIEILKECINSAMPPRLRRVKTTLLSSLSTQNLNAQTKNPLQLPVYMLVPAHTQLDKNHQLDKDMFRDDSSFTDSAEGTPINFSSAASLSDETLQYPLKEEATRKQHVGRRLKKKGLMALGSYSASDMQLQRERRTLASQDGASQKGESSARVPTKNNNTQKHNVPGKPFNWLQTKTSHATDAKKGQKPLVKNRPKLNLHIERQGNINSQLEGFHQTTDATQGEGVHKNLTFHSVCHTTPTEEAVYCFYENDSDDLPDTVKDSPKIGKILAKLCKKKVMVSGMMRREQNRGLKQISQGRTKMSAAKFQNTLIVDETPPCYSLSSSVSSLSDFELCDLQERSQVLNKTARHVTRSRMKASAKVNERSSSQSSMSFDSDNDLIHRCISSAIPKKKKHSSRRRNAERKQKLKTNSNLNPKHVVCKEWKSQGVQDLVDEVASDKGSDLDSVEWKAIQEGANSIVSWLRQASACLAKEHSSESDSILSFMSGLSVGSTLQLTLDKKDKKQSRTESCATAHRKVFQEGKKVVETRTTQNKIPRTDKGSGQQKPIPNLPVVFRGRTVIYMPNMVTTSSSSTSTPKKTVATNDALRKTPTPSQPRSRSLHRTAKPTEMADVTLLKRSATPPARMNKGPLSGSSRNSTPSRQPQRKSPSPPQLNKQPTDQRTKAGGTQSVSSPKAHFKSTANNHKTQKSPVRIPFMQKPNKKPMPGMSPASALDMQVHGARQSPIGKKIIQANKLDLMRMSPARSGSTESDRSGFLRQLTFIKESSSLIMRHRSDLSSSESMPSLSQRPSPRKGRPGLPAVFLCSSRCEELKVPKTAETRQKPVGTRATPASKAASERPPRRISSESPSRLPVKSHPSPPEAFKRYSSSPHINIKRTISPSQLSSCSESCAKEKCEERGSRQLGNAAEAEQDPGAVKGTWRRIRDEDIPHILKSTLPSSALALVNSPQEEPSASSQVDIERKMSDAVVQTEDLSITKTNSSTSPTLEIAPLSTQGGAKALLDMQAGSNLIRGDSTAFSLTRIAKAITFTHESPPAAVGPLLASRHTSPSRAVRVTPFNYIPSPSAVQALNDKTEKMQAQ